jgi:hypothetical protein
MPEGVPIEAHWELSNKGFHHPNRDRLIDLAVRLAALIAPGFAPPRQRHPLAYTAETEEYGGYYSSETYRLGDDTHGLEVVETVFDPHDGIAPYSAGATITAYGLPDGAALRLEGSFYAPLTGQPNPVRLVAQVPPSAVPPLRVLLQQEFGATTTAA